MFNSEEREGAAEEADVMEASLVSDGFLTKKLEWRSALELRSIINLLLDELLSQGLSLLVLAIMSHGRAGILTGCNGSHIPISDILEILRSRLPERIPLVC